mmetsp:Transcript_50003/g.160051  ORF Transcript_50003/g.160051 Transcript_50003/m.160051 type:complete len:119 (-) Transcript_50003:93-449(-)
MPRPPDILMLDYMLDSPLTGRPMVLGTDLIAPLQSAGFAGLICMRSAMDSAEAMAMYAEVGANGCISKTCTQAQLKEKLAIMYRDFAMGRTGWLGDGAPAPESPCPAGTPRVHMTCGL